MGGKDLRLIIIGIFITNEYTSARGQESPALIHHRRRNSQGPLSSLPLTTHSRALHRSHPQAFHPKLSHQLSNLFIVITFPLKITQRALTAAPSLTKSFAHICTFLTFHFHSTCPWVVFGRSLYAVISTRPHWARKVRDLEVHHVHVHCTPGSPSPCPRCRCPPCPWVGEVVWL